MRLRFQCMYVRFPLLLVQTRKSRTIPVRLRFPFALGSLFPAARDMEPYDNFDCIAACPPTDRHRGKGALPSWDEQQPHPPGGGHQVCTLRQGCVPHTD